MVRTDGVGNANSKKKNTKIYKGNKNQIVKTAHMLNRNVFTCNTIWVGIKGEKRGKDRRL